MTTSIAARRACLAVLGVIVLVAAAVVFTSLASVPAEEDLGNGFMVVLFIGLAAYWALGSVIVLRADGHSVGWLFAVAAALLASTFTCFALAFVLDSSQPPVAIAGWAALVGSILFAPALLLTMPAVMLVFPTGRLPGPRWRIPVFVILALVITRTLVLLVSPHPSGEGGPPNPLQPALPNLSAGAIDTLAVLGAASIALSLGIAFAIGILAIIVRFRRSVGDQRLQMKWFLAAMVPAAVLIPLDLGLDGKSPAIVDLMSIATLPLAALAVAIAILRYRLYDIDRFISRTLAYGVVTALLLGVYAVATVGLQGLLSSVTSNDSLAVAASTLLVAGLFTPLRRRVQTIVDRRFDRARYDAAQTTAAFSERLRDQVDLPTLADDLDATIRHSLAPRSLALWIREGQR